MVPRHDVSSSSTQVSSHALIWQTQPPKVLSPLICSATQGGSNKKALEVGHSVKKAFGHSVSGSELQAIQRAIEITNSMHELHSKNIVILTDSRTACMLLLSPTGTYSSTVEDIRSLLVKCNNKKSVKIEWIKAHAGIKGNELAVADRGAKDAHQKSDITMFPLCVQEIFGNIFMLHKKYWLEQANWIRPSGIGPTDLTGAGQFLRSVRKDEFGPTEMQFDTKTEVPNSDKIENWSCGA